MNSRECPACAERYPLQHGRHLLPDGGTMDCGGTWWRGMRITVDPRLPPGVVEFHHADGRVDRFDLLATGTAS